jgi:hypothetical protein
LIAFVLGDDEIEGSLDSLCFRGNAKQPLRPPYFGGVEAEMLMRAFSYSSHAKLLTVYIIA